MLVLSVCLFFIQLGTAVHEWCTNLGQQNQKSAFLDLDFEVIDVQTYPVDF